jgi:putative ABC transport system ATP-binding protein
LADEPTGALDTTSSNQIMDIFDTLNKEGKTIIMITHDDDVAKRAKQKLYLKDGKVVNTL